MKRLRFTSLLAIAALAFGLPFTAGASVKKEGSWPTVEKKVSFEFDGLPSEGLKELAKKAGWSVIVSDVDDVDGASGRLHRIHLNVDEQPADAVLEALFLEHDVVAHRSGKLITVRPARANTAEAPPGVPELPPAVTPPPVSPASTSPAPAPIPTVRGEDRSVIGGDLVIRKDEVVHTISVLGGSLTVEGTVTGDLVVTGGSATVARGARVLGSATVLGGTLEIEDGARIDGDASVLGGVLQREDGAVIGGRLDDGSGGTAGVRLDDDAESTSEEGRSSRSRISQIAREFGQSVTTMALLFVVGCVLLALLAPRMDRLRTEVASRPMRSFALGLVGALLGSIGTVILFTVLCITVLGIPIAVLGVLAMVLAFYGAFASVLTTFGAAVAGHKTKNPYLHLLVGCATFLVASSIPWFGGAVTFVVAMIAIGSLLATRCGGLLERRRPPPASGLV